MKAAYLTGHHKYGFFASTFVKKFLCVLFGQANVIEMTAEEFSRNNPPADVGLMVITGTTGEHSPCPEILHPERLRSFLEWGSSNNRVIYPECDGSYNMLQFKEYSSPSGVTKSGAGFGIIRGVAKGTHPAQIISLNSHQSGKSGSTFDDIITVSVSMENSDPFLAPHSFSPMLYIDDSETDIDIIAKFNGVSGNPETEPVALAIKNNGLGKIMVGGILPTILPEFLDNIDHLHVKELRRRLYNAKPRHQLMWQKIFDNLGDPYKKLPGARALCYGSPS